MTRALEIARFEIQYRLRRPVTWVFAIAMIAIPMAMMQAIADAPQAVNSPLNIAGIMTLMSIAGMLISAAIFGEAATRDVETGTQPLFYTMPIRERDYLAGRFLGAFTVNVGIVLFGIIGLLLGLLAPYGVEARIGPVIPGAYAEAFFAILLPNLFFTSAILFTVATLSRSTLPAYLSAIGLFGGYLVAIDWKARLANRQLAAMLDPFGATLINELTDYLPAAEQGTARLGMPPVLLANRALWIAAGVAVLILLWRRFRFTAVGKRSWRRTRQEPMPSDAPRVVVVPAATREFGPRTAVRQMLSVAWRALNDILRRRIFLIVLFAAIVLVFAFGWDVGAVVFDTSTWPVTHLIATLMRGPASMAVMVLIVVYAGELVWTERDRGVAAIVDSEPVSNGILLAGKCLALLGMLVVLQIVLMIAGIALQAIRGYYAFEVGLYVKFMFGFIFASYLLFAVLAVVVHVVVNNKHAGHFVMALYIAFYLSAAAFDVHNLIKYGADSGWIYSDLNGFGPYVKPFVWFKLYWSAWALLLAVAAALFWVRGTEGGWRARLGLARQRLSRRAVGVSMFAIALVLSLGGFIFYNTNVLNDYSKPDERMDAAAEYERRYRKYENAPQPQIVSADLRIEIYPERHAGEADLGGTYTMVNRTAQAIPEIHVVASENVEVDSLGFDRPARLQSYDDIRHQYRIFVLKNPLAPGDTIRLAFKHAFRRHGFPNAGINTSVTTNGAYFDRAWLPRIGYQPQLELDGQSERRKRGLPPARPMAGRDDTSATRWRYENHDADVVSVNAVIGTSHDQVAVTTGTLIREWKENGRNYFQYRTDTPLMFAAPVLSARYAVHHDRWNNVALKIFYHPTHTFNIDRMFRGMKASLDYYTRAWGPYPFNELRIVEFPRYANFARAHPHTIAFSEGGAFLTRIKPGDVDRTFFVVAHETAHQWWGGQISPARARGGAMLSETLAQYGSMMVLEKTYGREQVRKFYGFELDRYLRGRSLFGDVEDPLLDVREQSFVYYQKGGLAMYSLKEHIGEERMNAALRAYLTKWRDAGPPYATSRDFYRELQAVTPDSLQYLLTDLFETITLWNLGVTTVVAERVAPNDYRVAIDVDAKKVRSDSVGKETETTMNDLVDIAVYGASGDQPLYLRKHRIRSGVQRIVVNVTQQPGRVGVDPYQLLIQRERSRKLVTLTPKQNAGAWRAEYRAPTKDSARVRLRLPQF